MTPSNARLGSRARLNFVFCIIGTIFMTAAALVIGRDASKLNWAFFVALAVAFAMQSVFWLRKWKRLNH